MTSSKEVSDLEHRYRQDFPILQSGDYVYLDSAATSLKPQCVVDSIHHYYTSLSANVHRGVYHEAYETTRLYEEARETIAHFIHANPEEIIYTRGATQALNFVAMTFAEQLLQAGDEVIVSELEHHSLLLPFQALCARKQASLVYVPLTKDGKITLENLSAVVTSKTKLIALHMVSNVFGYRAPIEEITAFAHSKNIYVVVDGAQAVQHFPIDVKAMDVDFFAFSGHKMLGPTGIGVLYGKRQLLEKLAPLEYGGDMNDFVSKTASEWKDIPHRFEAGTMPIASVLGLAEAVKYLEKTTLEQIEHDTTRLYRYTFQQLKKIPGITIYNPHSDAGLIAFNIDNVHPHDAASFYAEQQIALRAGHHCAQLVIQWLNIEACLRASLYFYNTFADADRFIETTKAAVRFFKSVGF